MSKKIIALLGMQKNIDKLLSTERGAVHILLEDLTLIINGIDKELYSKVPRNVRLVEFFDYTPKNYEEITLKKFGEIAEKWFKIKEIEDDIIINGVNIGEVSNHFFCTKVLQRKINILLTVQAILEKESPDLIYTDAEFYPYVSNLNATSVYCIGERKKFENFNSLTFCYLSLISILYNLFYKTLLSKILNFLFHSNKLASANTIFIGSDHMLRNLKLFLEKASKDNKIYVLKPMGSYIFQNINLFNPPNNYNNPYFDGLLSTKEFTKVFIYFIKILYKFYKIWKIGGFKNAFVAQNLDVYELLEADFLKFIILNMLDAIKCTYVAYNIIGKYRPRKVFFAWANWWGFSAMNKIFQKEGVITLSYNHGMIQEIIPHCSSVDIMLCSGEFDRKMLEKFSSSKQYINFGFIFSNMSKTERKMKNGRNILILSTTSADKLGRSVDYSGGIIRERFFHETLSFIDQQSVNLNFDKVVIKLHPLEDESGIDKILNNFPNLKKKVYITKNNLYDHIANAKVIFCLLSTVILDCINYNKPFFIYDSASFYNRGICFYDVIDNVIKYRNVSELNKKYELRMQQTELNKKLQNLYYGAPNYNSYEILYNYIL